MVFHICTLSLLKNGCQADKQWVVAIVVFYDVKYVQLALPSLSLEKQLGSNPHSLFCMLWAAVWETLLCHFPRWIFVTPYCKKMTKPTISRVEIIAICFTGARNGRLIKNTTQSDLVFGLCFVVAASRNPLLSSLT